MKLSPQRRQSLERSVVQYEKSLDLAASYLAGRGFTEATARSFRLGVVDDPLPGDEAAAGRLAIPYLTRAGVVAVRFRCIQPHDHDAYHCPKYWGYPGASSHLFNVQALFGDGVVVCVTEGELDTVILAQCGLASVAVPGAQNWKPHYPRLFEDFQRIVMMADGDEPGAAFAKKVASAVHNVTVVPMPAGMDVNETYLDPQYGMKWLVSRTEG